MYAVIETGGKQYKVQEGDKLKIEKLALEAGSKVEFDKVLAVGEGENIEVGTPSVSGAKVQAEVVTEGRGPKIKILKFRRRKHSMKRQGHRQDYTEVVIKSIKTKKAAAKKAEAK